MIGRLLSRCGTAGVVLIVKSDELHIDWKVCETIPDHLPGREARSDANVEPRLVGSLKACVKAVPPDCPKRGKVTL